MRRIHACRGGMTTKMRRRLPSSLFFCNCKMAAILAAQVACIPVAQAGPQQRRNHARVVASPARSQKVRRCSRVMLHECGLMLGSLGCRGAYMPGQPRRHWLPHSPQAQVGSQCMSQGCCFFGRRPTHSLSLALACRPSPAAQPDQQRDDISSGGAPYATPLVAAFARSLSSNISSMRPCEFA
jgi:hypothetical protein